MVSPMFSCFQIRGLAIFIVVKGYLERQQLEEVKEPQKTHVCSIEVTMSYLKAGRRRGDGWAQTLVVNSYIMPNQDLAFVGSTGYVVLCLLCSGFPIPLRNLIGFLRGISYITYVRYCSQILVREQFLGTSRASLLSYFDMKLSNGFNFLGLILIYLALQFCTYVALWRLAARVRR